MDFDDLLYSMKTEKSVKYLKFRVALDSLRTVWQVFDTFSIFQGKTILRNSNVGGDGWHLRRQLYDRCKKTVILASFEATLFETKCIVCKIVNMWSLNIKIGEF